MPGLLDGKRKQIVGSVSVGCTPKQLKDEVQTMVFKFHDFADLTQERGKCLRSPSIRAFGYKWKLRVYPLGGKTSSETVEYISCYLRHVGDNTVFAKCSFRCKNECSTFKKIRSFNGTPYGHGFKNYLTREDVLAYYLDEDGTLVIEVDMQIAVDRENDDVWYPKLNIPNDVLTQLYHSSSDNDTNTSDTVFDSDGKQFHGHTSILSVRAPTIFELTKDNNTNNNEDGVVVVPIPNMESDIFEGVLRFIYCVEIPTIEDATTATKYLLAANCLGIVDLKMYVESRMVEKFLDTSNAAEMLILADSHSCPLLKEATMKVCDNNNEVVMESEGWSQIEESPRLLVELLRFAYKVKQQSSIGSNSHIVVGDVTTLDVMSLRERLLEADLDIDGNQQILSERLKNHISSLSSDSTRNDNASSPPVAVAAAAVAAPQQQLRPRRQLRQPRR